jgi:hypothetical protein
LCGNANKIYLDALMATSCRSPAACSRKCLRAQNVCRKLSAPRQTSCSPSGFGPPSQAMDALLLPSQPVSSRPHRTIHVSREETTVREKFRAVSWRQPNHKPTLAIESSLSVVSECHIHPAKTPHGRQIGIDDRVGIGEPVGHVGALDHFSIDRDITVQQVYRLVGRNG